MSHPLLETVRQRIRSFDLIGRRVLVAVSGGSDSVALLRLCHELQSSDGPTCVVAHFDHAARPDSADDAHWVAELCRELGVEFHGDRNHAAPSAATEEEFRRMRYEFLNETARSQGISVIFTGHTRDDQVETVLHHLLRGTGLTGLSGIPESRELTPGLHVVRPLLSCSREELRDYLASMSQSYRDDPSNNAGDFTRNRLRHELLPLLKELGFESAGLQLERLASQAAEIQTAIAWQIDQLLAAPATGFQIGTSGDEVRFRAGVLTDLPRHLARELFVAIWKRMSWSRQKMGHSDWDRLVEAALTGKTVHAPGGVEGSLRGEVFRLRKLETP